MTKRVQNKQSATSLRWLLLAALTSVVVLATALPAAATAYPNPQIPSASQVASTAKQDGTGTPLTPGNSTTTTTNVGIPGGSTAACESPVLKSVKAQYKAAEANGTTGGYTQADVVSAITSQLSVPCTQGITLQNQVSESPVAPSPVSIPQLTRTCPPLPHTPRACPRGLPPTYIATEQVTACDGISCYVAPGYPANSEWSETYRTEWLCDGIWASSAAPANNNGWNASLFPFWSVSDHWEWEWPYAGYTFNTNYILTRDHFTVRLGYGPVSYPWTLWIWVNDYNNCNATAGLRGFAP